MMNPSDKKHSYCPTLGTPYLKADNASDKTRHIFKARCKLWTCPYCSQVNKHQHYIRILNGCNRLHDKGYKLSFVTITSHERVRGFENSYRVFQSAWKKLSMRARRKALSIGTLPLEYVLIPELHTDNTLHWHGVFSSHFSTRWWKDNARQSGLGYQAKAVKLETGIQATNYCLKYVTKHIGQENVCKGFRRVSYSQGFPPKPAHSGDMCFTVVDPKTSIVECIEDAWRNFGYDVFLHKQLITEIIDKP